MAITIPTRIAIALLMLVLVSGRDAFAAGATSQTNRDRYAARLIEQLERIDPHLYFDVHDNAHEHLQALMIARFDATPEVMRAIDRLARDKRREKLIHALYGVLGFVKDPDSIPWLREKGTANERDFLPGRQKGSWTDYVRRSNLAV